MPYKVCPFNCVYCQLKNTTRLTMERKEYVSAKAVLSEIRTFIKDKNNLRNLDYITLAGSGEPLLNSKIKYVIEGIKKRASVPAALITNSAMLCDSRIRKEILKCDLILPSLDAVTQDVFEKIDRPIEGIKINDIIEGLVCLRNEFSNKIWLEIVLIKGINDDYEYIKKFQEVISRIKPDKIQLNTVCRRPSENWAEAPSRDRVEKIKSILGSTCDFF